MAEKSIKTEQTLSHARLTVSLKSLSQMLDAHRSSVRRWLKEAGIRPIVLGKGRNGAIRYRWQDIQDWLGSLEAVD
jgi:predicted site-specific integrase-resolvase